MFYARRVQLIRWGLVATLFTPLFFTPFTFFPSHFGKTILFQALVEVLAVAALAIGPIRPIGRIVRAMTSVDWVVLLFLLFLIITSFTGINPSHSFWGDQARANGVFTWLHVGVWYALFRCFVREKKEWHTLLCTVALVGILVALSGFFQDALPVSWRGDSGEKLSGILGNSAYLAFYLVPTVGFGWISFFSLGASYRFLSWQKMIMLAAIAVIGSALFFTNNRGAYLGVLAGGIAWCTGYGILSQNKRQRYAGILCAVGMIGLLFAGMALTRREGVRAFPRLFQTLNSSALIHGTGETRLMAWGIAWEGIRGRPLLGWGRGNYEAVFSRYYNPAFLKHSFSETVWDTPHNWPLEVALDTGVIGFLAYAGIVIAAIARVWRRVRRSEERAAVGASVIATLVAYGVVSFFLFETTNTLLLWFLLLAYCARTPVTHNPYPVTCDEWRRKIVVGLIGLAVLYALFFYNFMPLRASYHLRQAQQAEDLDAWVRHARKAIDVRVPFRGEVGVFLAEQFIQRDRAGADFKHTPIGRVGEHIASMLDGEARLHPLTIAYPVWQGQICMALFENGREEYFQCAERALTSASHLSPKKQDVLFLLGRLYVLKKDFQRAIRINEQAVAADPSIGIAHWFLGLAHIALGTAENGIPEVVRAVQLGYGLNREQTQYVIDVVDAFASQKKYVMMAESYRDLRDADPGNVNWYIKLAAVYARIGDKSAALETVRKAVALDPSLKESAEEFIKNNKLE